MEEQDFSITVTADNLNSDKIPRMLVDETNSEFILTATISNLSEGGKTCLIYFQPSGNLGTIDYPPSFSAETSYQKITKEFPEDKGLFLATEHNLFEKVNTSYASSRSTAARISIPGNSKHDVKLKLIRSDLAPISGKRFYLGLVAEAGE